jgi:thiol-disulfide isomerase/thioredoxin
MRVLKSLGIAVALVSLQACTGKVTQNTTPPVSPEAATAAVQQSQAALQTLPSFAVQDAAGKQLDLTSFKGKKVFVNLWATWCPPCRAEMPSINKLYQAADKEKVQFVMLSLDNDFELAKKYVQEKNLDLPVYYPAADLPPLFTVNGIPTTFIFNEEGQLIAQHEGSENYNTAEYRQLFGAAK